MTPVTTTVAVEPTGRRFNPFLPVGIACAALLLSLFFHSPRLWALAQPLPGSTYWDRGLQFMQQCDAPIGSPLADAGLVWRLAPALLAKALGLHGRAALVIPWLGLLVLLSQCAGLVLRRTGDRRLAFLTTALIGTTGATLTVTGWLGLNDAWYASALVALAFQPSLLVVLAAASTGPWIDERFILALPLALFVRATALGEKGKFRSALAIAAAALAVYLACRLFNLLHLPTAASSVYWQYIRGNFQHWLPWTSLGWFMGMRAAWVLVVVAIGGACTRADWPAAWWPAALAAAPLLVITVLASDSGRSPTMLLPLVLLGMERLISLRGVVATQRILAFLLVANLLMPAMHVTYQNGDMINMLPVEIVRWLQHP
jgi:hypothetical protein